MIFMTDCYGSTCCSLIIGGARLMHGPISKILPPQDRRPCVRPIILFLCVSPKFYTIAVRLTND